MADEKDTSAVFPESFFQLVFCIYIQMIGRLVQKKNIELIQFTSKKYCHCLRYTA